MSNRPCERDSSLTKFGQPTFKQANFGHEKRTQLADITELEYESDHERMRTYLSNIGYTTFGSMHLRLLLDLYNIAPIRGAPHTESMRCGGTVPPQEK